MVRWVIMVFVGVGLVGCGGAKNEPTSNGITISGIVYLPESGEASLSSPVPLMRKSVGLTESPVTEIFDIELYDSQANLLATTQTESDGSYAFSDVDPELLVHPDSPDFTAYILRATPASENPDEPVLMISRVGSFLAAADGEDDTEGDFQTRQMAEYQILQESGSAVLGQARSMSQRALRLEGGDEAATSSGEAAAEDVETASDLQVETVDGAIGFVLTAFREIVSQSVGDLTPVEAVDALFNLETGSSEEENLVTYLSTKSNFEGMDPDTLRHTLEISLETLRGYQALTEEVWAESDQMEDYLLNEESRLKLAVSANVIGKTVTELEIANANTSLFETQMELLSTLDVDSLLEGGSSMDEIATNLSVVLTPSLVLSMAGNPDVQAVLGTALPSLLAGETDFAFQRMSAVGAAWTAKADDADFWSGLVEANGTADSAKIENFIGFFDRAIETGQLDDFFSGKKVYQWGTLAGTINPTVDYAAMDDASFIDASGEDIAKGQASLDPDSCVGFCGKLTLSGLGCDDHCNSREDCAPDKADVCGENYKTDLLDQYGMLRGQVFTFHFLDLRL